MSHLAMVVWARFRFGWTPIDILSNLQTSKTQYGCWKGPCTLFACGLSNSLIGNLGRGALFLLGFSIESMPDQTLSHPILYSHISAGYTSLVVRMLVTYNGGSKINVFTLAQQNTHLVWRFAEPLNIENAVQTWLTKLPTYIYVTERGIMGWELLSPHAAPAW